MDLDSLPQPHLTDLYEYLLNFDHFTTIDLHIIGVYVTFTKFVLGFFALSVYYILVNLLHSKELKNMPKKNVKPCETELSCKATAALQEEIKDDLSKTDGSLKELIENDEEDQDEDQNE